jgi:uncharacterized membrane protein
MDERDANYEHLLRTIAALTQRVYNLEQQMGLREVSAPPTPIPTPIPTSAPPPVPIPSNEPELDQDYEAGLESQIGGRWLNRIGIVAVLIGVSYFLKYAFDNAWIGPAGRVMIGLAGGLAIVFWSEYVRRCGHEVYSYSLKAVGIGILYLSLWASAQVYMLVPNGLAFFAMTCVTAATVVMALVQNTELIAGFAAFGAFVTPIALSTGENKAVSLFAYLAVLNLGALFISRYRPWVRMLVGSYIGTIILYIAWHARFYTSPQFWTAFTALTVFFGIFLTVPIVQKLTKYNEVTLVLTMANAAFYFVAIYELFDHDGKARQSALLAMGLGIIYFAPRK